MQTRTQHPAGNETLEEARRRFERWRKGCRGPGRIPQELWQLAAETAAVHGLEVTAARLQLDAGRLKQWMRSSSHSKAAAAGPPFVELPPLAANSTPECTLEWEDPAGHKLRICLKGQATAQVVPLSQLLWRGPS